MREWFYTAQAFVFRELPLVNIITNSGRPIPNLIPRLFSPTFRPRLIHIHYIYIYKFIYLTFIALVMVPLAFFCPFCRTHCLPSLHSNYRGTSVTHPAFSTQRQWTTTNAQASSLALILSFFISLGSPLHFSHQYIYCLCRNFIEFVGHCWAHQRDVMYRLSKKTPSFFKLWYHTHTHKIIIY